LADLSGADRLNPSGEDVDQKGVRLDFYLYATHEVATAAPVLSTLRRLGVDAAFVLEPPDRHLAIGSSPDPGAGWRNRPRARLVRLVDAPTATRLRQLVAATGLPLLDACRRDADVAVTTQGTAWLRRYTCPRVRLGYGVGLVLDSYGHGPVNRGFDAVLAHGDFSRRAMELRTPGVNAVTVGYPKWAAYRRGEMTREDARKSLGLAPDRPVLAYLPTWAHRASVDAVVDVLPALTRDWDVVVKPHHNSLRFERDRLDPLADLVPDAEPLVQTDLIPYLVAADAVVTDAVSGAFTEALLAGRPTIAITPSGELPGLHPAAFRCAPVVTAAADLLEHLADGPPATEESDVAHWVEQMFRDCAGHDDEEAAHALLQCARRPTHRWARAAHNRARSAAASLARRTDATWRSQARGGSR
jgi:hypothetical protein